MPFTRFEKLILDIYDAAVDQLARENVDVETSEDLLEEICVLLDRIYPAEEDPNDPVYQNDPQVLARELLRSIRSAK